MTPIARHHPTSPKSYPTNTKLLPPPLQDLKCLPHITPHNYSPETRSKPQEDHNNIWQHHTAPEANQTTRNPARTSIPSEPAGTPSRKTHKGTSRKPEEEHKRGKGAASHTHKWKAGRQPDAPIDTPRAHNITYYRKQHHKDTSLTQLPNPAEQPPKQLTSQPLHNNHRHKKTNLASQHYGT